MGGRKQQLERWVESLVKSREELTRAVGLWEKCHTEEKCRKKIGTRCRLHERGHEEGVWADRQVWIWERVSLCQVTADRPSLAPAAFGAGKHQEKTKKGGRPSECLGF